MYSCLSGNFAKVNYCAQNCMTGKWVMTNIGNFPEVYTSTLNGSGKNNLLMGFSCVFNCALFIFCGVLFDLYSFCITV